MELPIADYYRIETINVTTTPVILETLLDLDNKYNVQVNITPATDAIIKEIYGGGELTIAAGTTKIIPVNNTVSTLLISAAGATTAAVELFYDS